LRHSENQVNSVEELQEVMDFIIKFEKFTQHYGEWLQRYPPFNNNNRMDYTSNALVKTLWYLEQYKTHHWHCDRCGKTFKIITNKYVLRCRCGGELWLCSYREPSNRCDTCEERFKCLTNRELRFNILDLSSLIPMDAYQIIAEY